MKTIRVVRHGQTNHNLKRRYQGRLDVSLNDLGRQQAETLASLPELEQTERIICSPLKRALETAQTISSALDIPLEIDKRLTERCLGAYEGLTKEQAAAAYPDIYRQNITRVFDAAPPGGETPTEVCRRVKRFLDELANDRHGEILIVTHGFVARAINAYFHPNKNETDFFNFNLHNGEVSTYRL